MAKRSTVTRPVALVAALPGSPLPRAPCYAIRTDQSRDTPRLDALPDKDLPALHGRMIAVIDDWVSAQEVYSHAYTDAELAKLETIQFNYAYKPLVESQTLRKALEADGFTVVEPNGGPASSADPDWSQLAQHLTMTSFDAVMPRILDNQQPLVHGMNVESALAPLLGAPVLGIARTKARRRGAALAALTKAWSGPMVNAFHALLRDSASQRWIRDDARGPEWADTLSEELLAELPPAAARESSRRYREAVLLHRKPAMRHVLVVPQLTGEPLDPRRLRAAAKRAAGRNDTSIREWVRAQPIVDATTFTRGATKALELAIDLDFKDLDGFIGVAPAVARVDPELCLRVLMKLAKHVGAAELRRRASELDTALPLNGYNRDALAAAAAYFSSVELRRAAEVLEPLLSRRGIVARSVAPPRLESLDASCSVTTDVAHLVLGDPDAIRELRSTEDPDDWPVILKKHGCVGVVTGADGRFRVRVVGAGRSSSFPRELRTQLEQATSVARFPLRVEHGALVVNGIVGSGGSTIAVPPGKYAAEVFSSGDGVLVVIAPAVRLPAWSWGDDLPSLPLELPSISKPSRESAKRRTSRERR